MAPAKKGRPGGSPQNTNVDDSLLSNFVRF